MDHQRLTAHNESNKVQSSEKSSRQQSDGLSELDRGFNLFVEGMELLGWNDDSKDAKKDEIDVTFNAMVDVMDSLGFGKELTEPNKSFQYFLDLFICKLKLIYSRIFS